jgi:hypothetical protein
LFEILNLIQNRKYQIPSEYLQGDEEHYTGTSSLTVSSLGALARSSAQSLKKAFSRDMDR